MLPDNMSTLFNSTHTGQGGGCPVVDIQLEGVVLPPVLIVVVVVGFVGNLVALWIFCFRLRRWNANTLFLFNLVLADFLALLSLPLRIHALLKGHWVFGDGLCRINLFLMFSNRTASIALMSLVALYRYFKVVHPHHHVNRLTKRQAAYVLALVWVLVAIPRVPMLAYSHIEVPRNRTQCFFFTSYREASAIVAMVTTHHILMVVEFVVPMLLLLFCSVRIRSFLKRRQMGQPQIIQKAMRVCGVIVGVFMVCFLPTGITTVGIWVVKSYRPWDCASFYAFTQLNIVSLGLNFLNSALDPLVYVFSSSMFKRELCSSLPHLVPGKWRPDQREKTASSSGSQSTT